MNKTLKTQKGHVSYPGRTSIFYGRVGMYNVFNQVIYTKQD